MEYTYILVYLFELTEKTRVVCTTDDVYIADDFITYLGKIYIVDLADDHLQDVFHSHILIETSSSNARVIAATELSSVLPASCNENSIASHYVRLEYKKYQNLYRRPKNSDKEIIRKIEARVTNELRKETWIATKLIPVKDAMKYAASSVSVLTEAINKDHTLLSHYAVYLDNNNWVYDKLDIFNDSNHLISIADKTAIHIAKKLPSIYSTIKPYKITKQGVMYG